MPLLALGLNHRTAPVAIRELTVFSAEKISSALQELMTVPDVREAAIISTCNRTEIYCHLDNTQPDQTLAWFLEHHGIQQLDYSDFLYHYFDAQTIRHLFRVASGLDSMVLGEPQILGQLKTAYRHAEEAGTLGPQLGKLFQQAFSVAKQVRTETTIGSNPVSIAFAAVRLAQQLFSQLSDLTVLLIGAGETIELAAKHLCEQGVSKIIIANRSVERSEPLARLTQGKAVRLADLPDWLPKADIVLSSTASQLPIIGKGAVEAALKQRKHQPMFMLDIAVPRDIEPQVADLADVYLYNVDDLRNVTEENRRSREIAAKEAEAIIQTQVDSFLGWQLSLNAVETIRLYRENAQQLRQQTLEKARQSLTLGKDPYEVLEQMANSLTNKLLHATTSNIDRAAREDRQDLLKAANILFSPPDSEDNR